MEKINLQTDTQEFLFYSYFRETWDSLKCKKESNKEDAIYVCFQRAYRDFCRTLSFEKKDGDFPRVVYNQTGMTDKIEQLITLPDSQKAFDDRHRKICDKIVESANGVTYLKEKFYYGQAQKCLNMTLKYMALVDLWSNEFTKVKEYLHVPLDSYILKAVFHKGTRDKINEKEKLIADENDWVNYNGAILPQTARFKGDYPKGEDGKMKPVAWSKISTYDDYMIIQKKIKKCIPEGYYPLVWENKVWLAFSKVKSGN